MYFSCTAISHAQQQLVGQLAGVTEEIQGERKGLFTQLRTTTHAYTHNIANFCKHPEPTVVLLVYNSAATPTNSVLLGQHPPLLYSCGRATEQNDYKAKLLQLHRLSNSVSTELVGLRLQWPWLRIDGIKQNRLGGNMMAESNSGKKAGRVKMAVFMYIKYIQYAAHII